MLMNADNSNHTAKSMINKHITTLSSRMVSKPFLGKLFFTFFANYLLLKTRKIKFEGSTMGGFEQLVTQNLGQYCARGKTDFQFLIGLLVCCYEMYVGLWSKDRSARRPTLAMVGKSRTRAVFSKGFLGLLRGMDVFQKKSTWINLFEEMQKLCDGSEGVLCYSDTDQNNLQPKKKLKQKEDWMQFLMKISFHLLAQSHSLILDNFIALNKEMCGMPISQIMQLSNFIGPGLEYEAPTRASKQISLIKHKDPVPRDDKIVSAFKNSMKYLCFEQDRDLLISLPGLCFAAIKPLSRQLLNKILKEQTHPKNRPVLYQKIIEFNSDFFFDTFVHFEDSQVLRPSVAQRTFQKQKNVIKNDVMRTKFFKGDKHALEQILMRLDNELPSVGYFQGLNCLAAFLLDLTDDVLLTYDLTFFILMKQMSHYFDDDFRRINKLIFIAERLILRYHPESHVVVENSEISHPYYLTPIIITIFFGTRQYTNNEVFLQLFLDLFLCDGWIAFFKVFLNYFYIIFDFNTLILN